MEFPRYTKLVRLSMGSRGAFIDVDLNNFEFKSGGKHYRTLGVLKSNGNVRLIEQDSTRVKAPEYSHTPGRIYAVIKNGKLKHLAYYDENHNQAVCIDFEHDHGGVQPHRHVYLKHDKNAPGVPPTADEQVLIQQIIKEFQLS